MTLLHCAVYGTAAVLVLMLLRALFRRHTPAWLWPLLWILAGLRFLLPIGFSLPFPMPEPIMAGETALQTFLTAEIPVETVSETTIPGLGPETETEESLTAEEQAAHELWLEQSDRRLAEMQAERERKENMIRLRTLLTRLWVLGSAITGGWFLILYLQLVRYVSAGTPTDPTAILPPLRRNIRFLQTDTADTPMTFGILHPVILLPDTIEEEPPETRQIMLLHEYCHIRRLDVLTKIFLLTVTAVHWWNPAVWLLLRTAGRDMEFACDEAVVRQLNGDIRQYAEVLLTAAERKLSRRKNHRPALPFGESPLTARITALFDRRRKPRWLACLLLCAAVFGLVCCAPARLEEPPEPPGVDLLSAEKAEESYMAAYAAARAEEDALNAELAAHLEELRHAAQLQENTLADLEAQYTNTAELLQTLEAELAQILEKSSILLDAYNDRLLSLAWLREENNGFRQSLIQLEENGLTPGEVRQTEILLEKIRQSDIEIAGKQSEADTMQQQCDSMAVSSEQCKEKIAILQETLTQIREKIELTRAQLNEIHARMES